MRVIYIRAGAEVACRARRGYRVSSAITLHLFLEIPLPLPLPPRTGVGAVCLMPVLICGCWDPSFPNSPYTHLNEAMLLGGILLNIFTSQHHREIYLLLQGRKDRHTLWRGCFVYSPDTLAFRPLLHYYK